jgi:hypothetical protein
MATNGGVEQSNCKANLLVYYNEGPIANIFGFSDLKKKHQITYNSNKEDTRILCPRGQQDYKWPWRAVPIPGIKGLSRSFERRRSTKGTRHQ